MPVASTPKTPHTPCTEMAPQGSSTFMRSQKYTLPTTSAPATVPMIPAAHGATNAHGAVIATSPASMPLQDIEMSGLPCVALVTAIEVTNPKHAAISVFTA